MKTLRWGMIGCGDVTERKSGPGFSKAAHAQLVAVMRRNGALLGVSDTRRPGGAVATVEEIRALDQSRRRWR